MDEGAVALDELLRRRHDLEQLQQAERNRLAQVQRRPRTPQAVYQSLERTLQALEQKKLQALEEGIRHLLKERTGPPATTRMTDVALCHPERVSLPLCPRDPCGVTGYEASVYCFD